LTRAGYTFVTGDQFAAFSAGRVSPPPRAVLVTFDDGYADLLHTAVPILEEMGVPAVTFVVAGMIGHPGAWQSSFSGPSRRLCNAEELDALTRKGVELGGHSMTHPDLSRVTGAALEHEISGCAAALEALGLPRPRFFAFPYGRHNESVRRVVREAGFVAAFSTHPGLARSDGDPWQIPRLEIVNVDHGRRFQRKVALAGALRLRA
jgi:peptidoglycan/xylan/chitin deacetylase (PgdA/CDA1 family)